MFFSPGPPSRTSRSPGPGPILAALPAKARSAACISRCGWVIEAKPLTIRGLMPIVRLDHVSLSFGLKPLLDDVALQLRKGERVCLLGRNGEGKSSLQQLIRSEEHTSELQS